MRRQATARATAAPVRRWLVNAGDCRRGAMLVTTLVLMIVCSLITLWLARTLLDQQTLNKRRRELARAFYAAEAGVQLVLHWGNVPADYTLNPSLFEQGTSLPSFPALRTQLAVGGLNLSQSTLESLGVSTFTTDYTQAVSRLTRLRLLPPTAADPVNSLLKVVSTGSSLNGNQRTVTAYLAENTAMSKLTLSTPASLISFADINFNGNSTVHWGEVWAKGNINGAGGSGKYGPDSWVNFRAEGNINGGTADPKFYSGVPPGTLKWPTFDYQTFKSIALAHNNYYYQKNGTWFVPGQNGTDVAADPFSRVINHTELIFLDTLDRQAPRADGSNLFNIQFSGNSNNSQIGVYWFGGNVTLKGQGNPPAVTGTDPSGSTSSLSKVFLNGILYAAGTIGFGGNANIYGSAIAQRGFTSFTGTADCYYNTVLTNGIPLDTGVAGSRLRIALQVN